MARDLGSLLHNRRYVLYLVSRLSLIIATQMISLAVGWQLYEMTHRALALGLSGLATFLPGFLFVLPGGHVADIVDRRRVLLVCHLGVALCGGALWLIAHQHVQSALPFYGVLVVTGTIRAFSGPAGSALMPNLMPREDLERAIAFSSSIWQVAMIIGPSVGGALYAAAGRATVVYTVSSCGALVAFGAVLLIGQLPVNPEGNAKRREPPTWSTVFAGLRYVWSNKVIFGAISLDLFAVLLGGAVALLPIFASDLLKVGPGGLGMLRGAPGAGAILVALTLSQFPLRKHAGVIMFICVFLFGLATIVFGESRSFVLSLGALFVIGASDMISVVVRTTLVQLRTPDEMRGRVSAVNLVFIGASNELGEFESGVTAAWLGPRLAVLVGGIGTCLVVVAWSLMFPALRGVDRLDE